MSLPNYPQPLDYLVGMSLRKVFKNLSYLLVSEQLARVASFFQVILIVRYLGTTGYGIWSLTQAFPAMFLVLTDMGVNSVLLRRIARSNTGRTRDFETVVPLKLGLSLVFLAVILVALKCSKYEPEVRYLLTLSALGYLASSFVEVFIAAYRAVENFFFESVINVLRGFLFLVLSCVVIYLNLGLSGLMYGQLSLNGIILIGTVLQYAKRYGVTLRVRKLEEYMGMLKESVPFMVLAAVNPMYVQIDVMMLSKYSTYDSVGIYNAAYRIILFLWVLPVIARRVLFSRFSILSSTSSTDFEDLFSATCRSACLISLPLAVGLSCLSDRVIPLLFSKAYLASISPLRILSVSIFFFYMRSVFEVALYASGFERLAVLLFALGTLLNVGLDYMLIPRFGVPGAAYAALLSEVAICMAYFWAVRRSLFRVARFKIVPKLVLSGGLMGLAIMLSRPLNLVFQLLIGMFTYAACLRVFNILRKSEYNAIMRFARLRA